MIHTIYYTLRRQDGTVAFEAAYCQYFADFYPYLALYETYPAQKTRILICRKTEEDGPDTLELANTEKVFMRVLVVREFMTVPDAKDWIKLQHTKRGGDKS